MGRFLSKREADGERVIIICPEREYAALDACQHTRPHLSTKHSLSIWIAVHIQRIRKGYYLKCDSHCPKRERKGGLQSGKEQRAKSEQRPQQCAKLYKLWAHIHRRPRVHLLRHRWARIMRGRTTA